MRLARVWRCRPAADPDGDWREDGARWQRLTRLVAGLGRRHWRLNLVLVEDGEMEDLNARYRGRHEPTDVLSFAYVSASGSRAADLPAGHGGAHHDLWLVEAPNVGGAADGGGATAPADATAGEVLLAPAHVATLCRRHGRDLETEFALLVVHGALHVLGWEHADSDERRAMRAVEARILQQEGLAHPLRETR